MDNGETTIKVPQYLYKLISQMAEQDGVSIDEELFSIVFFYHGYMSGLGDNELELRKY